MYDGQSEFQTPPDSMEIVDSPLLQAKGPNENVGQVKIQTEGLNEHTY